MPPSDPPIIYPPDTFLIWLYESEGLTQYRGYFEKVPGTLGEPRYRVTGHDTRRRNHSHQPWGEWGKRDPSWALKDCAAEERTFLCTLEHTMTNTWARVVESALNRYYRHLNDLPQIHTAKRTETHTTFTRGEDRITGITGATYLTHFTYNYTNHAPISWVTGNLTTT